MPQTIINESIGLQSTAANVDPWKASLARVQDLQNTKHVIKKSKEQEWAHAFKNVQTVETQRRKEEAEKIKKDNMLKKFRELELQSVAAEKWR